MSALANLTWLDLSYSAFDAGDFPTLHSSVSGTLTHLVLPDTNRTGTFPDLSSYSKLRSLSLSHNNFYCRRIPDIARGCKRHPDLA